MKFIQKVSIISIWSLGHADCCIAISMWITASWNCLKVRLWSLTRPFDSCEFVARMAMVRLSGLVMMVSVSSFAVSKVVWLARPAFV